MSEFSETCPICGEENRFIFRKRSKHWKTGAAIFPRNKRALKIKLSGCNH